MIEVEEKNQEPEEGLYFGLDDNSDDAKKVIVDGNNPLFEGTSLEGVKFKFICIPVAPVIRDKIIRDNTKIKRNYREVRDDQAIAVELFVKQVVEWENIHLGKKGQTPCTSENKKLFASDARTYQYARLINAACLEPRCKIVEAKEEEVKN